MFNAKIRESIDKSVLCWIATVDIEGQPSVSPKQIFTHDGDDQILIAQIASPQTVKNIAQNAKVCVSMIEIFKKRGFQYYGSANYFPKCSSEYGRYAPMLAEIAGPDFPILGVFCITVSKIKPIIAPSYKIYPDRSEKERIAMTMSEDYHVMPLDIA